MRRTFVCTRRNPCGGNGSNDSLTVSRPSLVLDSVRWPAWRWHSPCNIRARYKSSLFGHCVSFYFAAHTYFVNCWETKGRKQNSTLTGTVDSFCLIVFHTILFYCHCRFCFWQVKIVHQVMFEVIMVTNEVC